MYHWDYSVSPQAICPTSCHSAKTVQISHNNFSGNLPDVLGKAKYLLFLDASSNSFTGPMPNFCDPAVFNRSKSYCHGAQQPDDGCVPRLQGLWLSDNKLSGSIPDTLLFCYNMLALSIDGNQLTGPLPLP
eukprot:gene10982-9593_t